MIYRTRLMLLAGVSLLFTVSAMAQSTTMPNAHSGIQPAVKFDNGQQKTQHDAPPPALPGSQANPPSAAPAGKPTADMQPNDALFDAINRGDVVAARDSVNRGADLNARNVLGMTPLELSVDLNRNDISFLLLSLRGADDAGGPAQSHRAGPSAAPAHSDVTAQSAPPHSASARSARAKGRIAYKSTAAPSTSPVDDADGPTPNPAGDATASVASTAPRDRGDGGTPNPQAGFLGFDNKPATR